MRFSIISKITFVISFLIILQSILFLWITSSQLSSGLLKQKTDDIQSTLISIQSTLEFLSGRNEHAQIQKTITALGAIADTEAAYLLDQDNNIIAATRIENIGKNLNTVIAADSLATILQKQANTKRILKNSIWHDARASKLYAITPVTLGRLSEISIRPDKIGSLYLETNLSWINRERHTLLAALLVPDVILLLATGIGLAVYIYFDISKRIRLINAASTKLVDSEYCERIKTRGNDEITDLGHVFNTMANQILERHKSLLEQEKALRESEQRFRQLAENINEVFWLGSPDWNEIYYISPTYEKIWGFNASALYKNGRAWFDAVHPDDIDQVIADIPADVQHIKEHVNFKEYRIINPDGETIWIRARAFPIRDSQGNVIRIAGIAENITEQVHAEDVIRRTQKMDALGKLTGGIAHDYNNMLGVILGYSEILETMLKDKETLAKYAHEIHHAGERGAKLTKKLLNFSRRTTSNATIININDILNDEKNMLEKTLTARIQIKYDLEDKLWPIRIDVADLEDAIVNISINAMHAMSNSGLFTIHTSNQALNDIDARQLNLPKGNYVLLSFTDTGCGIDEVAREKIFDPFYSTKGEQGTGLGLSQVYGFVQRSHGAIKVYSEPGHGTRFLLYFPQHIDGEVKSRDENAVEKNSLRGNETILVVDDEPALLKLSVEIIQSHGYRVLHATSGQQALKILETENVDLILSDIIMPDMDGYALCRLARSKYPGIKCQLVSGFSEKHNVENIESDLQENILQKPFQSVTLLKTIRNLLNSNR